MILNMLTTIFFLFSLCATFLAIQTSAFTVGMIAIMLMYLSSFCLMVRIINEIRR